MVLRRPGLVYPEQERRKRLEGSVDIQAVVDERGALSDICLSGPQAFQVAAIENFCLWKIRPATVSGVATRCWFFTRIDFKLK